MPKEVIHAMHRLAAACKKHMGIVFTDKNGNIIDDSSPDGENEPNNQEITGVRTGVDNTNNTNTNPNDASNTENTGVDHEMTMMSDTQETHIHTTLEEGQYEEPTAEDEHVVEEMNMTNMQREHEENDVTENTEPEHEENDEAENADESQSAVEVENGYEEAEEDDTENDRGYTPTHGYNLRPRPTKHHPRLNLMQLGQNQHTWLVQNHIYMS